MPVPTDVPPPPEGAGSATWVRRLVTLVVLVLAAWFLLANRSELRGLWPALRAAAPGLLAVGLLLALLQLANLAAFHAAAQRAVGIEARVRQLVVPACAAGFLNLVVKSGGMAGLAALRSEGRRHGKPLGRVTTAYLLQVVSGEMGFLVVVLAAMVVMILDGHVSAIDLVGLAVFLVYVAVRLGVLVAATRSREATRRVASAPRRWWAKVRRRPAPEPDHQAADEVYDAVQVLRQRPAAGVPVLAHALAVEVIGVALVWTSLVAVGVPVTPGLPLTAYAVSVLFTIVGVLPAGLGTVELSMAAVLVASGVASGEAAAVVVVYRVFELWVPLALGALAAHRVRRVA